MENKSGGKAQRTLGTDHQQTRPLKGSRLPQQRGQHARIQLPLPRLELFTDGKLVGVPYFRAVLACRTSVPYFRAVLQGGLRGLARQVAVGPDRTTNPQNFFRSISGVVQVAHTLGTIDKAARLDAIPPCCLTMASSS